MNDEWRKAEVFHRRPTNVLARRTILAEQIQTPNGMATIPPGCWVVLEDIGQDLKAIQLMEDEAFRANYSAGRWETHFDERVNGQKVSSIFDGEIQ